MRVIFPHAARRVWIMTRITFFLLSIAAAALPALPACAQNWEAPPAPPEGAAPNQAVPPLDAAGNYVTVNRELSRDETSWHVRAALNVAALGCRDAAEAETVAAYNRLLARHRSVLAEADAGVKAQYRVRHGAGWEGAHDRQMTRVYNFFAQPTAQAAFCAAAREALAVAEQVSPEGYADFAAAALPRLEAPFTGFYRDYDAYRVALAHWRNRGQPVTVAAAAPAPQGLATLIP
jgi:hypothetical protein